VVAPVGNATQVEEDNQYPVEQRVEKVAFTHSSAPTAQAVQLGTLLFPVKNPDFSQDLTQF